MPSTFYHSICPQLRLHILGVLIIVKFMCSLTPYQIIEILVMGYEMMRDYMKDSSAAFMKMVTMFFTS